MKTAPKLLTLLFVLFVGLQSYGATGNERGKVRNIKNFQAIKVSSGIDLYLKMGSSETLKIEADDDLLDDITTEVKNGTLHINMKQQNNWFNWGSNRSAKIFVTVKKLNELDVSAGCDVKSENTLEGEELKVNASSGSDVNLDVYYKTLSVSSSSGSDARVVGKVKNFVAKASSGSDIKARELEAAIGKLTASSGSDISVTIMDELYAKASSGADIKYYGNPKIKDTDTSSGGDISQR